jgi:hypothetical protein
MMETNITAAFKKLDDLNQAANALKKQGAIDIRIHAPINEDPYHAMTMTQEMDIQPIEGVQEHLYSLVVYVERSRFRQAEDTIIQFGGSF